MQKYTIGRGHEPYQAGYQKIELPNMSESVKRHLAILTVNNGEATIEPMPKANNQNINRVYVNGFRIKRKQITPDSKILLLGQQQSAPYRLHHFFIMNGEKIIGLRKNNDFSKEFLQLQETWKVYEDKKWSIKQEFMIRSRIIPFLIIAIFIALIYAYSEAMLTNLMNLGFLLFSAASLLAIPFISKSERIKLSKEKILGNYLVHSFLCPKCTQPLNPNETWQDWKNKGGHDCKAQW